MDYRKIVVPFISVSKIKNKADLFRQEFWDESVPINIENIIDLRLKLDIIPIPELQRLCDTDALITSNWKCVYVDNEKYMDERYSNRLRFSLAHEIGHFILHKDLYGSLGIKRFEDFYRFFEQITQEQYGYLENQANKFASYLLIPRDKLVVARERIVKNNNTLKRLIAAKRVNVNVVNSYIATPLSKTFGVSDEAMEIALNDIVFEKI